MGMHLGIVCYNYGLLIWVCYFEEGGVEGVVDYLLVVLLKSKHETSKGSKSNRNVLILPTLTMFSIWLHILDQIK